MQIYFREKYNAQNDQSQNDKEIKQSAQTVMIKTTTPCREVIRTADVFGRHLKEFQQRADLEGEQAPLIFWMLAGYFRADKRRFEKTGLFRVTSSHKKVRELELHLSQGNFQSLKYLTDPQIVANYWKHLLRELREPLVP